MRTSSSVTYGIEFWTIFFIEFGVHYTLYVSGRGDTHIFYAIKLEMQLHFLQSKKTLLDRFCTSESIRVPESTAEDQTRVQYYFQVFAL